MRAIQVTAGKGARRRRGSLPIPALLALCVGLVVALVDPVRTTTAFAETDGIPTPFGTANDPTRPVPRAPEAAGPGIVAAKLVASGPAEVEELGVDGGGDLAGVVVDLRVAGASTTPLLLGSTIRAVGAEEGGTALFAACVLASDPAITVTRGDGLHLADWNVTVGDAAFHCGGGSLRMAMGVTAGGFRLVSAPGAESSARLLLLFRAPGAGIGRVEFPGIALDLGGEEEAAPKAVSPAGDAAKTAVGPAAASDAGAAKPAAAEAAK